MKQWKLFFFIWFVGVSNGTETSEIPGVDQDTTNLINCILDKLNVGLNDTFSVIQDPLVIEQDNPFDIDVPFIGKVNVNFPYVEAKGFPNYEINKLNATLEKENNVAKKVFYDIAVAFNEIIIKGKCAMQKQVFFVNVKKVGDFLIDIKDLALNIVGNIDLNGEDSKINDFQLGIQTGDKTIDLSNIPFQDVVQQLTKNLLDQAGDQSPGDFLSPIVKSTVNDLLAQNKEQLSFLLKQC